MLEEIIAVLEKEAEKCQSFAEEQHRNGDDHDLVHYWIGKRRGLLDAVKYIKRLEVGE